MTEVEAIHARLNSDSTLTTLLTGGVKLYRDLPTAGISRQSMANAYGADGRLKPIAVVRGRAVVPTNTLRDADGQYTSTRQIVEIWFYDDPAAGYDTLYSAAERAYFLLQDRPVTDTFNVSLVNEINDEREPAMQQSCMLRRDYEIIGRKKTA